MPNETVTTCAVAGCDRLLWGGLGWCNPHHRRWLRYGDVRADQPLRIRDPERGCSVPGCDRKHKSRGLCDGHYTRLLRIGRVDPDRPLIEYTRRNGIVNGYRMVQRDQKRVAEHRVIMAVHMGRELRRDEEVHHINGDRADNRLENLELWSTSHPPGQRVEDKLAWAHELIDFYES